MLTKKWKGEKWKFLGFLVEENVKAKKGKKWSFLVEENDRKVPWEGYGAMTEDLGGV